MVVTIPTTSDEIPGVFLSASIRKIEGTYVTAVKLLRINKPIPNYARS